jgi:hypothetical protein
MAPLLTLVLLLSSQTDPAMEAAKVRQDAVKTASIKFKRTEVVPRGSMSDSAPVQFKGRAPWPADDFTLESVELLLLDGAKYCYEDNHFIFLPTCSWWRGATCRWPFAEVIRWSRSARR